MEPRALSVKDTAAALSIGRTAIYVLIKNGDLEVIKIGRRTLLTTEPIRRLARFRSAD